MKNLLTVLAFAATMLFGTQMVSAQSLSQDNNRPEVIAKEKTSELSQELGLNGDQQRAVFRALVSKEVRALKTARALVSKEVSLQKSTKGKDLNSAPVKAEKEKINADLQVAMKKILTDAQYAQWMKDQ